MIRNARKSLLTAAVAPLLLAGIAAASPDPESNPDPTCLTSLDHCVKGSASLQMMSEGNGVRFVFGCEAVAAAGAAGTVIRSESEGGCVLMKGVTIVDTALGVSSPGSFAATQDMVVADPNGDTLRVCWRVLATFVQSGGVAEHAGCMPALPSDEPDIEDIAGDANGLNVTGIQVDTRPASYDRADLLTVRLETTYAAIPVGDDGIDYQPTGVAITHRTQAIPGSFENTFSLAYRLDTVIAGCRSYLEAATTSSGTVTYWDQIDGPPTACPNPNITTPAAITHPAWTATIDSEARTIRLHYPFSSLSAAQAQYLKIGNTLQRPRGATFLLREMAGWNSVTGRREAPVLLDTTATGPDFVIGSDVPADVPCTRSCP